MEKVNVKLFTNDVVLDEIMKELNWKERIVVKTFRKTSIKVYRLGMIRCFNFSNN